MSANNYQKLFKLTPDLLCIAGPDGFFKEVNPAFSKNLGYSEAELLAKPFIDFVHPDDVAATIHEMERLNKGEQTILFENRYKHKDGHYITLSWTASSDSEDQLYYAVARNITSKKIIQNRLTQIQGVLNSESIIALTDQKGTITEVNDKFCEISGYSREELVGQNHRILNSGTHPKEFFVDLWRTISSGNIWSGLIINRRKSGEKYYVQSIIAPFVDLEGQVTQYLAIRYDVSSQFKVKGQLSKTLEILNETSSIAKVGGWELEVATGELTWTDQTFEILEVEKKDGQKPILPEGLELFIPEHQPIIEDAVNKAITEGVPYSLEIMGKTAKGKEIWVYTNGKPNYVDGKIVSLSGTIQDIDDRKRAEHNYNLARQKSIHNSKLASLGELAASIAHEINNPLAIIQGSAFLMARGGLDEEKLAAKVSDIDKSCNRVAKIVKSLKKFSRSDNVQKSEPKVLADIVREALLLTESKVNRSHATIDFTSESEANILCDEIEIEQVLVNLINNAVDAINVRDDKWIKIHLSEADQTLKLTICDSGEGIPADMIDKLFEPFYTTKQTGEGTGLGLSIVKGILEDHHANIYVDKELVNTCFTIEFPIYEAAE